MYRLWFSDLFFFWRFVLALIMTIWFVLNLVDLIVRYWRLFHSSREWGTAGKYLLIQALRVNWRDVRGEVLQIGFWTGAFVVIIYAHRIIAPEV